jgi:hypothetical protein
MRRPDLLGFLLGKRYVLMDRDPLYAEAFRGILKNAGAKPLRLPARSPNLNSYAERFVLSIKTECLDRMVPLGEGHLRRAIAEYMAHYHHERNHQGLGNALIDGEQLATTGNGAVVCRDLLVESRLVRSPGTEPLFCFSMTGSNTEKDVSPTLRSRPCWWRIRW